MGDNEKSTLINSKAVIRRKAHELVWNGWLEKKKKKKAH
jgi:hypothetical protein